MQRSVYHRVFQRHPVRAIGNYLHKHHYVALGLAAVSMLAATYADEWAKHVLSAESTHERAWVSAAAFFVHGIGAFPFIEQARRWFGSP